MDISVNNEGYVQDCEEFHKYPPSGSASSSMINKTSRLVNGNFFKFIH
jgi:hypothetical protein